MISPSNRKAFGSPKRLYGTSRLCLGFVQFLEKIFNGCLCLDLDKRGPKTVNPIHLLRIDQKMQIVTHLKFLVLVLPDGEVSVDSLSPAHTLSSVPSPSSVEPLSPYSSQVSSSPSPLLALLSLCSLNIIFNANFTHRHAGHKYLHAHPPQCAPSFCPDGVRTLTAALCFYIVTHAHTHTLETPIHKALKHLVTQIFRCQSERYPTLSLGKKRC